MSNWQAEKAERNQKAFKRLSKALPASISQYGAGGVRNVAGSARSNRQEVQSSRLEREPGDQRGVDVRASKIRFTESGLTV